MFPGTAKGFPNGHIGVAKGTPYFAGEEILAAGLPFSFPEKRRNQVNTWGVRFCEKILFLKKQILFSTGAMVGSDISVKQDGCGGRAALVYW